jgi:sporulation integral membrane protein YlbJ
MKKFFVIAGVIFCLGMLIYPAPTFAAANSAINVWWQVVCPSLLPFFIIAELLSRLGAVHFLGVLLEPVMRPLFRLPGCAAFAIAMGFTSGFPAGASLTASLRQQQLISRQEGERLVAFTNNASPLFIFVAVSVGLLGQPGLGLMLATVHYGSNLLIGILLRFWPGSKREPPPDKALRAFLKKAWPP